MDDFLASHTLSLIELVEAVRALDYGRPSDGSVDGMVREGRVLAQPSISTWPKL